MTIPASHRPAREWFLLVLALLLVGLCEWLYWPRTTYVPIVIAGMLLASKAVSGYVVYRIERVGSQP